MARRGRPAKANPRHKIAPSKRSYERHGPTKEHLRQRIEASGSESVSSDYPLDVLL